METPFPRVRQELDIVSMRGGEFLLSDVRNDTAFAVSANERYLCKLLDGTRTPQEVIDSYVERFHEMLTRRNLEEFVEQLRVHHLLEESDEGAAARRPREGGRGRLTPLLSFSNAAKLNRALDLLLLLFGWLLHPVWCVFIAVAGCVATFTWVMNFSLFLDELSLFAAAHPFPVVAGGMILCRLTVDFTRTLVFVMVLRKHGARLRSFFFSLYRWLIPTFACDPGHSLTTVGGGGRSSHFSVRIWVELALGSLAILGWQQSDWGSVPRQFFLLLTIPVLIGLLLQLNPFARLDLYWLLVQRFDWPGLYEKARAETRAWLQGRIGPEALSPGERLGFRLYGLGSYLWSGVVHLLALIGGFWLFFSLYGTAGVYGFALLVTVWHGGAIRQALGRTSAALLPKGSRIRGGGSWFVRWPARLVLLGLLLLIGFLPYNHEIIGDARLVPEAKRGVRTQLTDEITEVLVSEGEWVAAGDVLVRLSAREIVADIAATEAELARARAELEKLESGSRAEDIKSAEHEVQRLQSELRYHEVTLSRKRELFKKHAASAAEVDDALRLRDTGVQRLAVAKKDLELLLKGTRLEEIHAAQAEVAYYEALLDKHRGDLELTELRAPISGRVSTPNLKQRVGQVAEKGELILVVQDTSNLRVEITADEEAAARVKPGMEARVRLRALDGSLLMARVESVAQSVSQGRSTDTSVRTDHELFVEETRKHDIDEFRFRVVARLEETLPIREKALMDADAADAKGSGQSQWALVGMTGEARIVVGQGVLWAALLRPVVRFIRTDVWSWLP